MSSFITQSALDPQRHHGRRAHTLDFQPHRPQVRACFTRLAPFLYIANLSNSSEIRSPAYFFFFFFFFRFCICWSAYHTQFTKSLKQPGYRQQIFPDLVRRSALPGSPLWSFLAPASDPTQGELEDLTRLLRNLVWSSSSTPVFFLHFEIDYHLIL